MADTRTEPSAETGGSGPGRRSRWSLKQIGLVGGGAAVAIILVVVLALIGTSSHKKPPQAAPTTTTVATPNLRTGAATPQSVTYVNTTVDITFGGMARSYLLSKPEGLPVSDKLPVVLVLHGRAVTPDYEYQRTDFKSVVSPSILVYPTGYHESWNAGNCCADAQAAGINDVGFIEAVIGQVKQTQADASQGKVYLAGYSNGGKMALTMACDDPNDFEAVAVFGATDAQNCANRQPDNVLEMGGSTDPEVPANNSPPAAEVDGFKPPSFVAEVEDYRQVDGCSAQDVVTTVGNVTLTSWVQCADGARVGQAVFAGQDHDWPAGSSSSPSGEGVAWAWFKALGA